MWAARREGREIRKSWKDNGMSDLKNGFALGTLCVRYSEFLLPGNLAQVDPGVERKEGL